MKKKFFEPEDQGKCTIRFLDEENLEKVPTYVSNLPVHYNLPKIFLCTGTNCPHCEAGFPKEN